MKEFEFNDIVGSEDINVPVQLDVFESRILNKTIDKIPHGRIYDFSDPLVEIYGPGGSNDLDAGQGWKNSFYRAWSDSSVENSFNNNAVLMVNGDTDYKFTITDTQQDITGEYNVPIWSSNAAIAVGQNTSSAFNATTANDNTLKTFRSGYIELSFKTDKQNSVIFAGDAEYSGVDLGPLGEALQFPSGNSFVGSNFPVAVDSKSSYLIDPNSGTTRLLVSLVNGKLNLSYQNKYGNNKREFQIAGNRNVADNAWHHVVINFGKPGVIREHGKKYNERFIEFWVDGQLDKFTTEHVNENQIIFPVPNWLMMDPALMMKLNQPSLTSDIDDNWWWARVWNNGEPVTPVVPATDTERFYNNFTFNNFATRNFESALASAFNGSIHTYANGLNTPLSKFDIKERYRLWSGNTRPAQQLFTASASIVSPVVSTNKKKALKIFWNNLMNEKSKNGIELDNSFQVHSYSISHKLVNSPTEVNNVDLASNKTINYLADVRVAIKDNVILWAPGTDFNAAGSNAWQYDPNTLKSTSALGLDADGQNWVYREKFRSSVYQNLYFSGVELKSGDRILLTNQFDKRYNGIYVFDSMDAPLVRSTDADSPNKIKNAVVRITDGYYKDTSWIMSSDVASLNDIQKWTELEFHPTEETINSQPFYGERYVSDSFGARFIDLEEDVNIDEYDLIVFMNYPDTNEEIASHFVGYDTVEVKQKYEDFLTSLQNVVANGSSLYVSSKKLAEDLGIVKQFQEINQLSQESDSHSAAISPFEAVEPAERYFDTHRINQYGIQTTIPGLTDRETYVLTDFISYVPDNNYDNEQYHAKYSYRQFGLQEGNEFFIPGLTLRKITDNSKLPGYKQNQKDSFTIAAVKASDINAGTVVAGLANNYYNRTTVTTNPYDDYATILVVHNGQQLNGQPINGKIFVNCIEDGFTFSREEYNKAIIQVIPSGDANETVATRAWQYSTTRLDRKPQRIDIRQMTSLGQTTPTQGGGGAFIQAPSNASSGVIRSEGDRGNKNYESDLYPSVSEEIYSTQEIPVLSMTWLGLQWLAE